MSIVIRLDTRDWCFEEGDESLRTPELGVYRSAADAVSDNMGLEIVETLHGYGDLWFFAADGSPLEASFSQEPHFNQDNTFFPGVYSLASGIGTSLLDAVEKVIASNGERSPQARIVVWVANTNQEAAQFGWATPAEMKEGVLLLLQILPHGTQRHLIFAKLSYSGGLEGLFRTIEDALEDA